MTDERMLRLLGEVLAEPPSTAPAHLRAAVLASVERAARDRRWLPDVRFDRPKLAVRGVGVLAVVVVLVGVGLIFPGLRPDEVVSPAPTATPTPTPSLGPERSSPVTGPSDEAWSPPGPLVSLEEGGGSLRSGVTYMSDLFRPRLRLRFTAFGAALHANAETDWCGSGSYYQADRARTSDRLLTFPYLMSCRTVLQFIRPWAVECGTPSAHPDAATLASAILANPRLQTQDRGTPADAVPGWGLSAYPGRALYVAGTHGFDWTVADPAGCRLLPEPGSGDPEIAIRDDLGTSLLLYDIDDELLIVRLGSDFDPTNPTLPERFANTGVDAEWLTTMLATVRDVAFLDESGQPIAAPASSPAP